MGNPDGGDGIILPEFEDPITGQNGGKFKLGGGEKKDESLTGRHRLMLRLDSGGMIVHFPDSDSFQLLDQVGQQLIFHE